MKVYRRVKQLILLIGDLVTFSAGFVIAWLIRHGTPPTNVTIEDHAFLFGITFFLWLVANYINGLYELNYRSNVTDFYKRFLSTGFMSFFIAIAFFYLADPGNITPKTILFLNVLIGYSLSFLWRQIAGRVIQANALQTRVLFVGFAPEVLELVKELNDNPARGYQPMAIVTDDAPVDDKDLPLDHYRSFKTIRPAISNHRIHLVVIAPHLHKNEEAMKELYSLLFWPVQLVHLPSFYERITGRIPPSTFSESWFLDHLRHQHHPVYDKWRSLLDYVAAIALGLIFFITLPLIALSIRLNSRGPIFFKQQRVGLGGRHFQLYKYRSMYALSPDGSAEIDGYEFAKKNDKRVTAVGKFLRKTHLDELPQIMNLLRRDITLIGPRPERPELVEELSADMPYYPLRHVVHPGLTGWAVLHQHYADSKEASLVKLQYDLYYIKNRTFTLDISILLKTAHLVARLLGR